MTLPAEEVERAAVRILADYDAGQANHIFSERGTDWLDLDDAYAIQRAVAGLRKRRGERCIGYKVGCLSPTIQKQFGLSEPVFGHVWESEMLESGARLSLQDAKRFVNFSIEGEIAIRLAKDIPPQASPIVIQECVECWFPVIELHNYVFRGPAPTSQELVAGNAMHAGVVAGSPSTLSLTELAEREEIRIQINGTLIECKRVAEIPGGPLGTMAWLASALARFGETLQAGQIVLTGSPGKLIPVPASAHIEVSCGNQHVALTVENPGDQ